MNRTLLALLFLIPLSASAEIFIGESLDWLGVSRLEIGEYKLIESKDRAEPGARWIERRFLLKRKSRLKGEPPKRIRFSRSVPLKTEKPGDGRRYLAFFNRNGKLDIVIDLKKPGDTASWERAFTVDFKEILGRRKILRALKNRLAYHEKHGWPKINAENYVNGKAGSGYLKVEAPFDSDVHNRLYGGSSVYLIIPADEYRLEDILNQTRDSETAVRARAAWRLGNYHTADTERRLREMLKDPGTSVLTTRANGSKDERVVYPVRQAAFRALRAMDVRVEKPPGYDKQYPDSFLE